MPLDLVSADAFLTNRKEGPPWILRPFLLNGSTMMLYGRQGIGKSSLALQLAYSLTSGEPWMGFPVARSGPVIYLQLDMSVEESRMWLVRASNAGMDFGGRLFLPKPGDGAWDFPDFNIFNAAHEARLAELVREVEPVAVILDTTDDGYRPTRALSLTDEPRQVIRAYRRACAGAAFIFLRHERKTAPGKRGKLDEDDPDAFSGPKEWEGTATASLQLARLKDGTMRLRVRKSRADKAPASNLQVAPLAHGFFGVERSHAQVLWYWPESVPIAKRASEIAAVRSKADLFRVVAARTGVSPESVKMLYYRGRDNGVVFPWETYDFASPSNGAGDE